MEPFRQVNKSEVQAQASLNEFFIEWKQDLHHLKASAETEGNFVNSWLSESSPVKTVGS